MALASYNGVDEYGGHSFVDDTGAELYVPDSDYARQLAARLQSAPQPELEARGPGRSTAQFSGLGTAPAQSPSALDAGVSRVFEQYGGPPAYAAEPAAPQSQAPVIVPGPRGAQVAAPYQPGKPAAAPSPAQEPARAPLWPGVSAPVDEGASAPSSGLTPYEQSLIGRARGGSPGVSQEQLQAKATQGVPIPSTYGVETTGAIPENPAIEAAWVGAKKKEYEAQQKIAESNLASADAQEKQAKAAAAFQENEWQKAVMHQRHVEWEAQQKVEAVKAFDADAQARYRDFGPDRFFKQKGTWATIGAAIAQGLGAYAAILGHTQNYAMQIIQSAQDRDVEAQRSEYLRDRDTRNNLVADIARATGDIDVATEAAKAIQLNIAANHAAEMAALSKRSDIVNNWELFQAQFQAGVVDHMQKAYEKGLGNTVIKTAAQYKYPQAASGGGPATLKQTAEDIKYAKEIAEGRREIAGTPGGLSYKAQQEVAKSGAETQARERAKQEATLAETAGALSTTLQNIGRMRELSQSARTAIGVGKTGTESYSEAQSLVEETQLGYAKLKTGGVVTESDKKNAAAVVPDITSPFQSSKAKLDAFEKRAKQEYVNKVRAVDKSARSKKPSQILLEAGVRATPDDDKEIK